MTRSAGDDLSKHEVVRPEDAAVGSRPDGVHGTGLQVDQDGPGHVLSTAGLVVVDVDPLQLKFRLPGIGTRRVNAVLVTKRVQIRFQTSISDHQPSLPDDLPELCSDLVATLTSLNMDDLSHLVCRDNRSTDLLKHKGGLSDWLKFLFDIKLNMDIEHKFR